MKYQYNDGGRSKYFKGKAGDCVVRAVAIIKNMDYKETYDEIFKLIGYTPRNGVKKADTRKIMAHFGGVWHPTMKIGSGCRVHMREEELPKGRIICNVSHHVIAVIDGVVNDLDKGRERCVYGYWIF